MQLIIDEKSGVPIYDQIYQAIRQQILDGTIPEGEMLPSIRNLAKDLRISVITTKRAYEELEKEGCIYPVPGKGFYVAPMDVALVRSPRASVSKADALNTPQEIPVPIQKSSLGPELRQ